MFSASSMMMQQSIQLPYIETINTSYITTNGTYQDNEKYYSFVYINKIYSDREYIYDIYSDNKFFGADELKAEEKIIDNHSVPLKNNFLDYYE